jgi:hypothetical protein
MLGVQGSGPLREGDVPPWHKRTTVRAEKRRLLSILEEDDLHNKRDNNDIRLASDQRVRVPAIVLVECFTPSNIKDLYASIDTWPIRPPEYLASLKDDIRKWRTSEYGGAWSQVAMFARPDSGIFEYSADPSIPAPFKAVEFLLTNPLPSLTALVAVFYPSEERSDISDQLRKYFIPQVSPVSIRAKGRIARFTHVLPFSRAKHVYYNVWISDPDQLQRKLVNNLYAELEAHCWQWLNRRALGKVGVLSIERRPSIRCLLLDNLEPFGPIDSQPFRPDPDEWKRWREWNDSDSELPYREPRGPLQALGLNVPESTWTTENRDSFYFSTQHRYNDTSRASYISANRSTLIRVLGDEFNANDSGLSLFHHLLRKRTLGLLSAWSIEQMLLRYKEEISEIRDSSAASQSAYRVAAMLNDFLVREGHDATVVSRDASRIAALEYSFRETPPFVDLSDIRMRKWTERRADEQEGEPKLPICRRWREYLRPRARSESPVPEVQHREAKTEYLVHHYRHKIAESARLVANELELATGSISTSATLLQSMAAIRLQRWAVGIAVIAALISLVAIIVTLK